MGKVYFKSFYKCKEKLQDISYIKDIFYTQVFFIWEINCKLRVAFFSHQYSKCGGTKRKTFHQSIGYKRKNVSLYHKYTLIMKYMERVVFNPAQREILDVMSCMQTDEDLQALKAVLVQFLNDRLQRELDRLWDNGTIDEKKMDEWRNTVL